MIIDSARDFDVRGYLRQEMMPHFLCPGCGHGIALRALLWALHELQIDKDQLAVVSGIGCAGRLSAYIDASTFHVTHGRPLAYATGLALARPDLHVVVITGDGDCLAIGGNHLIHACRRNLKLTCLMLNNEVYGMTGGQVSPTTSETRVTSTTPLGNTEPHFDACALAAAAGAGFVGREVTLHVPKLKELIRAGLEHPGLRLHRGADRLHRDFRAQERDGLVARDDAAPDQRAAPERLPRHGGHAVPRQRPADRHPVEERPSRIRRRLSPGRGRRRAGGRRKGCEMSAATRLEIRIAGSGGQGLILAGKMLADALASAGRRVAQSQTYEPTSRGGFCNADLVIAQGEVDFPLATALDCLVLLDGIAVKPSWPLLKADAIVIADTRLCPELPASAGTACHRLPLTRSAIELGSERVANIVALGAMAVIAGLSDRKSLEQAVRNETPRSFLDLNLDALAAGFRLGEQALLTPAH